MTKDEMTLWFDPHRITRMTERERQAVAGELSFASTCLELAIRAGDAGGSEPTRLQQVRDQVTGRAVPNETPGLRQAAETERRMIVAILDGVLVPGRFSDDKDPLERSLGILTGRLQGIVDR